MSRMMADMVDAGSGGSENMGQLVVIAKKIAMLGNNLVKQVSVGEIWCPCYIYIVLYMMPLLSVGEI